MDLSAEKTVPGNARKAVLGVLNVITSLCVLAWVVIFFATPPDISGAWLWLVSFVGTLAMAAYFFLRLPRRYALPEFDGTRLDGAYLDGQDSKVLDYWRAAGLLAIAVIILIQFLL